MPIRSDARGNLIKKSQYKKKNINTDLPAPMNMLQVALTIHVEHQRLYGKFTETALKMYVQTLVQGVK